MESTLNAHFRELQGDIGNHRGFGRGADNGDDEWTAQQLADVTQCIKGGMRKFYFCGFSWSFLILNTTVTLLEGESSVLLPRDFGAAEGRAIISVSDASTMRTLPFGEIGDVYRLLAAGNGSTGCPVALCEEPLKDQSISGPPRKQIVVAPVADQDYTIRFRYHVNPDFLRGNLPYAYGGAQHAETLLAACKAAGEIDLDNVSGGPQFLEFQRLLQVSMQVDGRNKPHKLGTNLDRSDWVDDRYSRRSHSGVTVAGVEPD